MRILLTNDDGIGAPGLLALWQAAKELGEVHVIAPSKVRSACGHAVTFHRSLEAWPEPMQDEEGDEPSQSIALYGMPADCVKVGLGRLVPKPVDLVLSGINAGCNVGIHTIYSGTVAAAREAALVGVPAIGMSLYLADRKNIRWDRATAAARDTLEQLLRDPLPANTFLNVNLPVLDERESARGIRVVPASVSPMVDDYTGEPDESGHMKLTVGPHISFGEVLPGTDTHALFDGYVTVTPMAFDPTNHEALDLWRDRLGGDS